MAVGNAPKKRALVFHRHNKTGSLDEKREPVLFPLLT